MRKKILYAFFFILLIANGILLFMLINRSHNSASKDNFLTKELQFNEEQIERFLFLDEEHRNYMKQIEHRIRKHKEVLFGSFSDTTFAYDEVIQEIGELERKKEEELYTFFKEVRKLCTKDQAQKFDLIIKEALHKRGPKGRKPGRKPPPR